MRNATADGSIEAGSRGGALMAKMKAVQVTKAGGQFEVVEREVPQAGPTDGR
jgi:hypothetical protein